MHTQNTSERVVEIVESIADSLLRIPPTANEIPDGLANGIAHGHAGIAMFFVALAHARYREEWRAAAEAHFKTAARILRKPHPGLFTGYAGLLFASAYASRCDVAWSDLRDKAAARLLDLFHPPTMRNTSGTFEYDLISGVSGTYAALCYAGFQRESAMLRQYLCWLSEDARRWALPGTTIPKNDLGIAHGASGMLGALALYAPDEDSSMHAIRKLSDLLWFNCVSEDSLQWPSRTGESSAGVTRVAWCYGNPGIALTLASAALRMNDQGQFARAHASLSRTATMPRERWLMHDHSICHGSAGNALQFWLASKIFDDPQFRTTAEDLLEVVAQAFRRELRYGYQYYDPNASELKNDRGILTGASGIALALLTMSAPIDASWTEALALPRPRRIRAEDLKI